MAIEHVTDDIDAIDTTITHARIDTLYHSMAEQICELVIKQGGVMPSDAEFTIHADERLITEAYVPDASAFDEHVQEWVDGMFVNYLDKSDEESDALSKAIEQADGEPITDYDDFDWLDLPQRDDYDRISIEWIADA